MTETQPATAAGPVRPNRRRRRQPALARLIRYRVLAVVPVLLLVTLGMFALAAASPFDPARQYAGDSAFTATSENLNQIRHSWGLDKPLAEQYLRWLGHLAHGDLGSSTSLHRPVSQVLTDRAGWTVLLVGSSLVVVVVASLVLGSLAAYLRHSWFDRAVQLVAYAVEAMPVFWMALVAIAVLSLGLGLVPAGGLRDITATGWSWSDVTAHLALPVGVLALSQCSWFVLFVRDSVLQSLHQDHVTGAWSRGLPARTVVFGHALRTALLPFITLVGTHLPELVGGAVLVETVFSLPGLGSVTVQAAQGGDFPLLAAITLITAVVVLAANLAADIAYSYADPRVRLDG